MTDNTKLAGSIYQADGYWRFAVSVTENGKRRRIVKSSRDRAVVEAFADDHRAFLRPKKRSRQEYMADARALGSHTPDEFYALLANSPRECRYCRTPLNLFNEVTDHIVPVQGGGSDAIDNLQIICWECNAAKGTKLNYSYKGKPRPFRPLPKREAQYARFLAATTGSERR